MPAGSANGSCRRSDRRACRQQVRLRGTGDVWRAGRHRRRARRGYCRGLSAARSVCGLGVDHGGGDGDRGHDANQRPRPLANRSLPTNSTLLSCPTRCGNLRYLLVVFCSEVKPTATGLDAVERRQQLLASTEGCRAKRVVLLMLNGPRPGMLDSCRSPSRARRTQGRREHQARPRPRRRRRPARRTGGRDVRALRPAARHHRHRRSADRQPARRDARARPDHMGRAGHAAVLPRGRRRGRIRLARRHVSGAPGCSPGRSDCAGRCSGISRPGLSASSWRA